MKTYFVICFILLLALTVDARRRNRGNQRSLSQCHRVISRGDRDCSAHRQGIEDDLTQIHSPQGQHVGVFRRWVEDRARALNPDIEFETLVASGACTRMMCFKMMVEQLVRQPNYRVPPICAEKTGRQFKRESRTIRRTRDWTPQDMMTVFCAKAYDPNFKFH